MIQDPTFAKKSGHYAYCDYPSQVIIIDPSQGNEDFIGQVLFHEVVHWILKIMGYRELSNNEEFVDLFAHLLYQSMKPSLLQPATMPLLIDSQIIDSLNIKREKPCPARQIKID